jgi:hypothetical protein
VQLFAAGGYDDFYLLHLVTGSRAVYAIASLSGLRWNDSTLSAMLTALWRAVLYGYVVKRRPAIEPPPALTPPWRPWSELRAGALRHLNEPHLAKMVMTCEDYYARWGLELCWQVADRIVRLYDSGGKFAH